MSTPTWTILLTVGIRPRIQGMQELHRRNVINVNLELEDDDQSFPIHPYGEDGRGE